MREVFITGKAMERLRQFLESAPSLTLRDRQYLEKHSEELDRAHQVASEDIPPDVVTMNCRVRVKDLDSNEKMILTLVFPARADYDRLKR
jgi:regulator of nucleoside diphosphate kinase